ncbi:hypothetical protein [Oryzifoliimicrobium ureilyticus]|uniref:hypothetical protein n=1 Tax=Oryzifoliimicrobium ureilyticus TaxID=3113724 RepID=UPI0030762A4F
MKLSSRVIVAAVATLFVAAPLSAEAQARDWRDHGMHRKVCHVERHKTRVHGHWVVKTVRVCR